MDVNTHCEFALNKDVKGEVLIAKVDNKPDSKFVFADIFQVDTQDFFMTSDGKWNQKIILNPDLKMFNLLAI